MTPTEINIAIAEFCGWTNFVRNTGIPPNKSESFRSILIDYHGDLNAIHEAEKLLKPEGWRYYSDKLMKSVRDSDYSLNGSNIEARYKSAHATAPQRCKALLRTIGKRQDEKGKQ
jgi:hypothetical protein